MPAKPIIKVQNLSKQYQIGARQDTYSTLRDAIANTLAASLQRFRRSDRDVDTLWALKDVNFEVKPGEIVGIIGRNGAGKSTLLKILSRITEPTTGRAEFYGRIGSLLEVGTGFHPELTGRENIFLNGAVLGMKRAEIARKFDEIVAFSEIERFLDTPVKRYSSGMYTRLAFAVAAHLDPEILVVDEVLAVGDMAFQQKCLNKMEDAGAHGRTVLFVSHNMPAVARLCKRVILISDGKIVSDGAAHEVIDTYLGSGRGITSARTWEDLKTAPGDEIVRLLAVKVDTGSQGIPDSIDIRQPTRVEMTYQVLQSGQVLVPNYHFYNEEGICVFVVQDLSSDARQQPREAGLFVSTLVIPPNFLAEGRLVVSAAITTYYPFNVHVFERDAVSFRVMDSLEGNSARGDYAGPMPGVVRPIFDWSTQKVS
jgi:lipopolysaccharide transport system ATP-binding protein